MPTPAVGATHPSILHSFSAGLHLRGGVTFLSVNQVNDLFSVVVVILHSP